MLLFICIFEETLFTHYNFLIYIESGCEWMRAKNVMIKVYKYYLIENEREKVFVFSVNILI
ncbi:hypothetical protein Hanom_Chr13g01201311 [Helianthus anomalus]